MSPVFVPACVCGESITHLLSAWDIKYIYVHCILIVPQIPRLMDSSHACQD